MVTCSLMVRSAPFLKTIAPAPIKQAIKPPIRMTSFSNSYPHSERLRTQSSIEREKMDRQSDQLRQNAKQGPRHWHGAFAMNIEGR